MSVTVHWAHVETPDTNLERRGSVIEVSSKCLVTFWTTCTCARMYKKAHSTECAHVEVCTSIHSSFSCSLAACKMNDRLVPVNCDAPSERVSDWLELADSCLDEEGMRGGAYLESEPSLNVSGWRARGDKKQRIPLGLAFPLFGRMKSQSSKKATKSIPTKGDDN